MHDRHNRLILHEQIVQKLLKNGKVSYIYTEGL